MLRLHYFWSSQNKPSKRSEAEPKQYSITSCRKVTDRKRALRTFSTVLDKVERNLKQKRIHCCCESLKADLKVRCSQQTWFDTKYRCEVKNAAAACDRITLVQTCIFFNVSFSVFLQSRNVLNFIVAVQRQNTFYTVERYRKSNFRKNERNRLGRL